VRVDEFGGVDAGPMSATGPGCVKTFFVPQNCTQPGTIRVDTTIWAYFCIIEFGVNPGASSGHAERP
jgi:hypothetical protein